MGDKRDESSHAEPQETDRLLPAQSSNSRSTHDEPKDDFFFVYVIFYLLGIGSLLPWNFFTNAKQYFMYKLRNTTLGDNDDYELPQFQTHLQISFEGYIAIAATIPNILFMFLNTAATKLVSLKVRLCVSAVVMILMFVLTIIMCHVDTDSWQESFFILTLSTIIVMNAGSAILQGSIFGLASMFPARYTQAVMGGMGFGGTMAAVSNIIASATASSPLVSGVAFFSVGLGVFCLAFIGYLCMPMFGFARFYIAEAQRKATQRASRSNTLCSVQGEEGSIEEVPQVDVKSGSKQAPLLSVFKKLWVYGVTVYFVFFVTLTCYPALNSSVVSTSRNLLWSEIYFVPVVCFLFFNMGDLFGRTFAGWFVWPKEGSYLIPFLSLMRVLFVPLILLCNIQPRKHLPIVFYSDIWPSIFTWIFAISNGHLGTICMMYGPGKVADDELETAGAMMSFFLALGLGTGSLFSFVLRLFV